MYRPTRRESSETAQALYSSFRFKEASKSAVKQPGPGSYDCHEARVTRIPHQLYRTDRNQKTKRHSSCSTDFLYNIQQPMSAIGSYSLKSSTKRFVMSSSAAPGPGAYFHSPSSPGKTTRKQRPMLRPSVQPRVQLNEENIAGLMDSRRLGAALTPRTAYAMLDRVEI